MSARVDAEHAGAAAASVPLALADPSVALAPVAFEPDERIGGHALPSDHPTWMKDTLSLSQRARALIAGCKPVVVRVFAYWEHRVRSIVIGRERVSIDASGCYRLG